MRVFNWIWSPVCFVLRGSAMRTSEFDSSSEEEVGEEQLTPLHISWWVSAALASQEVSQHCKRQQLRCAVLCSQVTLVRGGVLAVSGHLWTSRWDQLCTQLCHNVPAFIRQRFSFSFVSIQVANTKTSAGVWRETLVRWPACESDPNISFFHFLLCVFTHSCISIWGLLPPEELQNQGVQEVFVFCTRAELHWYRVPSLLDVYQQRGFSVHHMPFPDGDVPELEQCCRILEELQASLENNRRTLIQWAVFPLCFSWNFTVPLRGQILAETGLVWCLKVNLEQQIFCQECETSSGPETFCFSLLPQLLRRPRQIRIK